MASPVTCPPARDLEQFARGQMTTAQIHSLLLHLKGCARCLQTVRTLQGNSRAVNPTPNTGTPGQKSASDTLSGRSLLNPDSGRRLTPPPSSVSSAPSSRTNNLNKHSGRSLDRSMPVDHTIMSAGEPPLPPDLAAVLAPPTGPDELGWLAHYRILKLIGQGGMGYVFKAEDSHLERRVALKIMRPEAVTNLDAQRRFLREARAMAALQHENIVAVYGVGQDGEIPYIAMEYLRGDSLENLFGMGTEMPISQVIRVGCEIASGLAAAHARGLIHRDIKPSNIWLEAPKARVKILDFGLARQTNEDVQLTRPGFILGSPAFMAPEQARGEPVDERCDLYSLGAVLYSVCTGRPPFIGDNTISVLTALAVDTPPPIQSLRAGVPDALAALITRMLAKSPNDRVSTARETLDELKTIERELSVRPVPRPPTPALPPPPPAPAPVLAAAPTTQPRILKLPTSHGTMLVETSDPDVRVDVSPSGANLHDRKTDRKYLIHPAGPDAEGELEVTDPDSGSQFQTKTFTIKRAGQVVVKAYLQPF